MGLRQRLHVARLVGEYSMTCMRSGLTAAALAALPAPDVRLWPIACRAIPYVLTEAESISGARAHEQFIYGLPRHTSEDWFGESG